MMTFCPLLGALPLVDWIVRSVTGKQLSLLGTGNVSVSAAFYHGGKWVGSLAVLSEAGKGIAAVLLARTLFPTESAWELVAVIALVLGRYGWAKSAGTTNAVWGFVTHEWRAAGLVWILSGLHFAIFRQRQQGRWVVLILMPIAMALFHPTEGARIGATMGLCIVLAWILHMTPDDLDLAISQAQPDAQSAFRWFRGQGSGRPLRSLMHPLDPQEWGHKAATLSQLKRWGYPVPMGWVIRDRGQAQAALNTWWPSPEQPLVVRSSAVGEDSEQASAAGQYESVLNVTTQGELEAAIAHCFAAYDAPAALQYRQDRGVATASMALLIQEQVSGVFSGVAFSRDPIARQGEWVVIEALPGGADQVVSGQVTPEQYQVLVPDLKEVSSENGAAGWRLPTAITLDLQGRGEVPTRLVQEVAWLARHLEDRYHGIPQDLEWTYDGQTLWLLQSRPITTLLPIWTRKIAAEVIPGVIRPLTWSVNRPLTCGVWGQIFTVVLGDGAQGLEFNQTATLHHGRAYFNASLLGQIFRRMGLPAESLEFLTRGAKFSKPPLISTLRNLPGLFRLLRQGELQLAQDFQRDNHHHFTPLLSELECQPSASLAVPALLERIEILLRVLNKATYYSILAPLSLALRQAIFRVPDRVLESGHSPEVASLRVLQAIATAARTQLQPEDWPTDGEALRSALATQPEGQSVRVQLEQFLQDYGYLSEVGTDIAVPTWQEDPHSVYDSFAQFFHHPPPSINSLPSSRSWKVQLVQRRLDLKGKVTTVYSRLLAELRWSMMAIAHHWHRSGLLEAPDDLFYLELDEVRQMVTAPNETLKIAIEQRIAERRARLEQDRQRSAVPNLVYGNEPPHALLNLDAWGGTISKQWQGVGASPGQVQGQVKVLIQGQSLSDLPPDTILVVPYTDSGWAPLLARVAGLISEVGGRLSHGAIVAREYGIPAVMDITHATQHFQDGQRVRIDGQLGTVELLD